MHITTLDYIICCIYVPIIYAFLILYARRNYDNKIVRSYFIWGFTVKLIGAIAIGLVYQYYYGFGDTFGFYQMGKFFNQIVEKEPEQLFNVLFGDREYLSSKALQYGFGSWYAFNPATVITARICAVLGFITFNLYLPTAILFALLSFSGVWQLYKCFVKQYPLLIKELAWIILFIPSVFFWGSGILKDTITLGAIGWLTYSCFQIFFKRHQVIVNIIIGIISAFIIYLVKAYILMAFTPALAAWIIFNYKNKIENKKSKNLLLPIFLAILIISFLITSNLIAREFENLALDKIAEAASSTASTINQYSSGSAYTLGDGSVEPGFSGLLKMIVPAIIVTFFRPFIWEANNPFSLASSLEGMILLYLTFLSFKSAGYLKAFNLIAQSPTILFCFIFSILFAVPVGIASGNFGTLVRYKIPAIPFYLTGLILLYFISRYKKASEE